jgi:hypothetical protein
MTKPSSFCRGLIGPSLRLPSLSPNLRSTHIPGQVTRAIPQRIPTFANTHSQLQPAQCTAHSQRDAHVPQCWEPTLDVLGSQSSVLHLRVRGITAIVAMSRRGARHCIPMPSHLLQTGKDTALSATWRPILQPHRQSTALGRRSVLSISCMHAQPSESRLGRCQDVSSQASTINSKCGGLCYALLTPRVAMLTNWC